MLHQPSHTCSWAGFQIIRPNSALMEIGAKLFELHCRAEEAQIKHFCAVKQHHERQRGGGGWQSCRAAESSRHCCCSHCPPAVLMRCTSSILSSFSQAQGRWCRTAGTWFTPQGGRLSHSLEWAQSVWSPLSLLLEKYSALAGRAGTDITRHKPAHPNEGGGADGHSTLQILLY